jgi:hypothetical protein
MEGPTRWARLAWQGFSVELPDDWCPGQLAGDFANGYARVEDETRVRLELRWESPGRRVPSASELVDNYLTQAAKKARGQPKPQVVRDRFVPELRDLDHEVFTWRGGPNAHSLVAVCPEPTRLVHLRVFFEDDDLKSATRRIFGSFRSTPEDGLNEWSIFGLSFRAAASWRLEQSALRTGCLQLTFSDDRDELEVARVSLAEMVLRKSSLEKWLAGFLERALSRFRWEARPAEHRGHKAVRVEGVSRASARPLGLFRRKRCLTALAWHCEPMDKVFVVRLVADKPSDPRASACAESIPCE